MASSMIGGSALNQRRVFVLVDKGKAQGVFNSWEAAEAYVDEHKLSLEHLLEFVTRRNHPDHLHLLAANWGNGWEFQGEWTRETPRWKRPPDKVRLDHYHVKGSTFFLLRQKEFSWETGLLLKVNPMAPDMVLDQLGSKQSAPPQPQWKPKLGALRPKIPPVQAIPPAKTEEKPEKPPLISDPEPPVEEASPKEEESDKSPPRPADTPQSPEKPKLDEGGIRLKPPEEKRPILDADSGEGEPPKPGISFSKRKPLRLKEKKHPKPIPSFIPTTPPPDAPTVQAGTEPVHQHLQESISAAKEGIAESKKPARIRKVWPMRLIMAVAAVFLGWGGGLFWVLKPEPTAQETVASISSLNPATVITIEPGQVFFQLPVDPIQQQRWVRSLGLDPLGHGEVISIPTHHALQTWSQPTGFVRPPYADVEVREWWNLRLRKVSYGFYYKWEDGSFLLLDLESDMLIGWSRARHLTEVLH